MAPQNIGIKAIELYFPSQCVEQSQLEKFDGVSEGKYTIGLGQTKMSFCDDREDIYSLALTTVSSLMKKYNIDPHSIGRLEVGTETILDKSKSVKSVLMQLFAPSGNTAIEGVDTVNACYGGTNALFNAQNWIESSSWDGRDAIVVAGDIALYSKGAARPSGGAGCVAMLIGPDAPIVFEQGLRGVHITHTYDFFKPDLTSEYPVVDGHYSLRCYSEALDQCYKEYNRKFALKKKTAQNGHANGHSNGSNGHAAENGHTNGATNGTGVHSEEEAPLDRFDYMCFHAPTNKTVQKSYARLLYNDYLENPSNPLFKDVPEDLAKVEYQASLTDRNVEKTFMTLSKKRYAKSVQPAAAVPKLCGNMYCASLYSSLSSLISNVDAAELTGKRVAMFSFGSGLASTMFSLRIVGDVTPIVQKLDLMNRLEQRTVVTPEVYDEMCMLREKAHLKKNFQPVGDVSSMASGTYYLTDIDDMFRRTYEIKS